MVPGSTKIAMYKTSSLHRNVFKINKMRSWLIQRRFQCLVCGNYIYGTISVVWYEFVFRAVTAKTASLSPPPPPSSPMTATFFVGDGGIQKKSFRRGCWFSIYTFPVGVVRVYNYFRCSELLTKYEPRGNYRHYGAKKSGNPSSVVAQDSGSVKVVFQLAYMRGGRGVGGWQTFTGRNNPYLDLA